MYNASMYVYLSISVPRTSSARSTIVAAGGHAVWASVSATCPLHLTVSLLVAACAVWLRKGNLYIVLSSASAVIRSRGRLWVGLLPNHLGRDPGCTLDASSA